MTIAKGEPWGAPGPLPAAGVVVRSDAEARAAVTDRLRAGSPAPVLGLLGGDLCRTLGGPGEEGRLRSEEAVTFPADLGTVVLDGVRHWFVAHLVARTRTWSTAALVMNAQWLGGWDVAPKAHPNDGILDLVAGALSVADRLKARRRLPLGTHLPHPAITTRRGPVHALSFERPLTVHLDGEPVGAARTCTVEVLPDALRLVI